MYAAQSTCVLQSHPNENYSAQCGPRIPNSAESFLIGIHLVVHVWNCQQNRFVQIDLLHSKTAHIHALIETIQYFFQLNVLFLD